MNLLNKFLSTAKWFWSSYLEMKKKSYPLASLGTKLIIYSLPSTPIVAIAFAVQLPNGIKIGSADFTSNDISMLTAILGVIIIGLGIYLIFKDLDNLARHTAKVFITGMNGTTNRFPSELLAKSEKRDARETVILSIPEREEQSLEKQILMYNSERYVKLYSRFILHNDCSRVYLGGLARVPFLVAYGACFSSVSAKVIYFDKYHKGSEWKLLNNEDENINFENFEIDQLHPNEDGNIGVALSFSNEIKAEHIPSWVRDNTIIVKSNRPIGKNLIKNQENLHNIAETFKSMIDDLSNKVGCKKIHLFLAVQSTFALEIGRKYQDGTHRNWVMHNFNAQNGHYEWALEISKKGITEYVYPDE
jgi:hypothetical protein